MMSAYAFFVFFAVFLACRMDIYRALEVMAEPIIVGDSDKGSTDLRASDRRTIAFLCDGFIFICVWWDAVSYVAENVVQKCSRLS